MAHGHVLPETKRNIKIAEDIVAATGEQGLPVDSPAVPNPKHENSIVAVIDVTDQPTGAYPVTPEPSFVAGERAAEPARIFAGGDPFAEVAQNSSLDFVVERAQFPASPVVPLNCPGHAPARDLREASAGLGFLGARERFRHLPDQLSIAL